MVEPSVVAPVSVPDAIFTVGHSTLELDRFVALLRATGVAGIADVRRHPGSRRLPWFGGEALAASLRREGLAYAHLPELGGRRSRRPDSPNGGWENAAFQGYADWMQTAEFAAGLERLEAIARAAATAIMCAEAPWWRCHRRLVADALVVRGWRVRHAMAGGRLTDHELTAFAVVEDGHLLYPPPQLALAPMSGEGHRGGGCLCGAVRYAVTGPLRDVVMCHCSRCLRTHGHAAAYSACARDDLVLERDGSLRWYEAEGRARGFCGECGASLFWSADGRDTISIAAGTLDRPTGLRTVAHIHTAAVADYYEIAGPGERFPGELPG